MHLSGNRAFNVLWDSDLTCTKLKGYAQEFKCGGGINSTDAWIRDSDQTILVAPMLTSTKYASQRELCIQCPAGF